MDSAGERVLARLAEALLEPGVHVVLRVEPLDLDARVGEAARVLRPHDRGDGRLLLGSVGHAGEGYGAAASRAPRPSAHAATGTGGCVSASAGRPASGSPISFAGVADRTEEKPTVAPIVGPEDPRRFTDSGIEVERLYSEDDVDAGLEERLGEPGEYPFTRGVHPDMYRSRTWTMRQYAGYASAKETNERFRYLIEHGSTGLSMAFDLPTHLGRESDGPRCLAEGGPTGVAIDSIDDMRRVFDQIPLDEVE